MDEQLQTIPVEIAQRNSQRQSLNVVIVDEELPYPLTSGKRIRTFNLVSRLAEQHQIIYVAYRNPDSDEQEQAAEKFAATGIETVIVDRIIPPKSGSGFYLRLLGNLFSPHPYSVAIHNSAAMREALRRLERTKEIDLWHCEWTPYAQVTRHLHSSPRLVMAHNVESQIWHRYYLNEKNLPKKWFIKKQWQKWERFETVTAQTTDCVVAVTEEDARRFRKEMASRDVSVVDNGVDTEYFAPSTQKRDPNHLLFLGSLDWRPNLDGIVQYLDVVHPEVLSQIPDLRVSLVGRNPPEWLSNRVANHPEVTLFPNVPDVRPHLHSCSALVVPLRIGGGSRLKILEALSTETPVISTAIGAEGLHLEPDHHLSMVQSVEELTKGLPELLQTPDILQAQAARGRDVVLEQYDWSVLAQRLDQVWQSCTTQSQLGRA